MMGEIIIHSDSIILVDHLHTPFNADELTQRLAGLLQTNARCGGCYHRCNGIEYIMSTTVLPAYKYRLIFLINNFKLRTIGGQ